MTRAIVNRAVELRSSLLAISIALRERTVINLRSIGINYPYRTYPVNSYIVEIIIDSHCNSLIDFGKYLSMKVGKYNIYFK